jgi:hypothetical protein
MIRRFPIVQEFPSSCSGGVPQPSQRGVMGDARAPERAIGERALTWTVLVCLVMISALIAYGPRGRSNFSWGGTLAAELFIVTHPTSLQSARTTPHAPRHNQDHQSSQRSEYELSGRSLWAPGSRYLISLSARLQRPQGRDSARAGEAARSMPAPLRYLPIGPLEGSEHSGGCSGHSGEERGRPRGGTGS